MIPDPQWCLERAAVKEQTARAWEGSSSPSVRRHACETAQEATALRMAALVMELGEALEHHYKQDIPFHERQLLARAALAKLREAQGGERG